MDIIEKLNKLAELQAQLDVIAANAKTAREQAIPLEIHAILDEISRKAYEESVMIQELADSLGAEIKSDVLTAGQSIKGAYLQAVYTKGRVTWDGKILEGMSKLIPQLEAAKKIGEPSVSLRRL